MSEKKEQTPAQQPLHEEIRAKQRPTGIYYTNAQRNYDEGFNDGLSAAAELVEKREQQTPGARHLCYSPNNPHAVNANPQTDELSRLRTALEPFRQFVEQFQKSDISRNAIVIERKGRLLTVGDFVALAAAPPAAQATQQETEKALWRKCACGGDMYHWRHPFDPESPDLVWRCVKCGATKPIPSQATPTALVELVTLVREWQNAMRDVAKTGADRLRQAHESLAAFDLSRLSPPAAEETK